MKDRNKPHRFSPSPYGSRPENLRCECGRTFSDRLHQGWLWRLLNPGKNWRNR